MAEPQNDTDTHTDAHTDRFASLHKKVQLKAGTKLWVWPESADAPELSTTGGIDRVAPESANAAILFVGSADDVATLMSAHLDTLSSCTVVWMIYAKGNRAPINRDTLWSQLLGYSWRAVSNVSYSDTLSAIRIRPLKPGEEVRQP